jgi:beta-glucosidase
MRHRRQLLALAATAAVTLPALAALLLYLRHPKRSVLGVLAREAGPEVFKFSDIPKGRALSAAEVDGYARRLLAEMTLSEKVLQMSGDSALWDLIKLVTVEWGKYNDAPVTAGAQKRLAIPALGFADGPRGVVLHHSTCFPSAMARGASWDRALQRAVGEVIGKEIRAQGGTLWGGVCVNLLRHPAWGRAQETLGEDPYLLGELAVPAVLGAQAHNVMGCAKHFALNSIDQTRMQVDVRVDERTLREVYLPHFKRLADAGVASFMSSYNRVNGDYAAENRHLLREILKGEWAYPGFVMSDFFYGVHDGVKAAHAGLDLEMPWTVAYGHKLEQAVAQQEVPQALVDDAVLRILRRKIDYASRPEPQAYPPSLVRAPAHVALTREVAEKSIVLLENRGEVLPLDRAALRTLAVVGRLAAEPNLGDHGSSRVYPPAGSVVTIVDGLRQALGAARVVYEPGADLGRARRAASAADAVVVVAGYDHEDEGEYIPEKPKKTERGGDRRELTLRAAERALIAAIAAANPRTIVVLVGGAAILVEDFRELTPAILHAFYPGEQGGAAIARILLGEVNPSGRLPFTVPRTASQLPPFDNRSLQVTYGYYHGYTLVDKQGTEPRYPFGYGLSYTRFWFHDLRLAASEVPADGTITASVAVTNTGRRAGEAVVQLYVGFPGATVDRPVKLLRGFDKLALAAGQTRRVTFSLPVKDLAYYDVATAAWVVERGLHSVLIGPSSRPAELLQAQLRVTDAR